MSFKKQAEICYNHCDEKLKQKAIDSGILLDNRMKLEYTKGGQTNSHFDCSIYLKYFSFEALLKNGYYKLKYNIS